MTAWDSKNGPSKYTEFHHIFKFIASQLKLCSGNCNKTSTNDEQFCKPYSYILCDLHAESKYLIKPKIFSIL